MFFIIIIISNDTFKLKSRLESSMFLNCLYNTVSRLTVVPRKHCEMIHIQYEQMEEGKARSEFLHFPGTSSL